MRPARALAGWGCLLLACSLHAQAFKCQGPDGRSVVYQQVPCEPGERSQKLDLPASSEARPASTGPAPSGQPTRRDRGMLQLLQWVDACRKASPAFAVKSGPAYRAWVLRNRELVRQAEPPQQEFEKAPPEQVAAFCSDQLIAAMEETSRPADPRLASPERTWALFVSALQQADRATALACAQGPAETTLKQLLPKMSDEDVRKMGSGFNGMARSWGDEDVAEYFVSRGGRAGAINFVNANGNWKISSL